MVVRNEPGRFVPKVVEGMFPGIAGWMTGQQEESVKAEEVKEEVKEENDEEEARQRKRTRSVEKDVPNGQQSYVRYWNDGLNCADGQNRFIYYRLSVTAQTPSSGFINCRSIRDCQLSPSQASRLCRTIIGSRVESGNPGSSARAASSTCLRSCS